MCRGCIGDVFGIEKFFSAELSRSRFIAASAAAIGVAATARRSLAAGESAAPQSTTVFYSGPILSMDDRYRSPQAVAIANGKILAVGEMQSVMSAVKIVSDGSPQQETAFQLEPYLNSKSVGVPNYTADELNGLVLKVKQAGWPVSIHCNGDASLQRALDGIEAAYGSAQPPTGINRIEHCPLASPDQIARMKRLGVQPSYLMNNLYYYGAAYRDQIFGADRTNRIYAGKSFLDAGIPFSIHSDCPCSPMAPLREIGTAVTRICSADGSTIGADDRVPLKAALEGMTTVAASHCGLGDKVGSLTPGKYADLAILESNPMTTDPAKLGDIKVSETWVAGAKVVNPA